jgi:hypothetical protein
VSACYPLSMLITPRTLVLIKAKYVRYVRARNYLGLGMELPVDAFKVLRSNDITTTSPSMEFERWILDEQVLVEYQNSSVLHSFLFSPHDKEKRTTEFKKQFLANVERSVKLLPV